MISEVKNIYKPKSRKEYLFQGPRDMRGKNRPDNWNCGKSKGAKKYRSRNFRKEKRENPDASPKRLC
jgi:hypothetical protein